MVNTVIPDPAQVAPHGYRLANDRAAVDEFLAAVLSRDVAVAWNPVPKAIEYAVMGGAQRIRPILALRVARVLDCESTDTMRAAAAVELIHNASLIVDDLPCMDNESMRRGQPAVHVAFGESTAILAAFSIVALAARIVGDGRRLCQFQLALLRTLDCSALVGGQSLDLSLAGQQRNEFRDAVNDRKTVPLFDLAVQAGCVSASSGVPGELESFGRRFGLAFQLTDDYLDGELDSTAPLHEAYAQCRAALRPFAQAADPLHELIDYLEQRSQA